MSLIICKKCGAQISDKSTNCIHCGAPTTYSLNANQDNQNNETESINRLIRNEEEIDAGNKVSDKSGKKKVKIIMIVILSILILAAITATFLLHGNSKIEALSNEEIFAVGSVQELMARSNDPDSIELKRIEVAKYNSEDNKSDNSVPCDYIVRLTYNANNDSIGLENGDTGELIAFVVIDIGDYIKYSIDQEIQALSLLLFSTNEDSVDVDLDLVNKVLANPSEYNLKIEADTSTLSESKDASIPKSPSNNVALEASSSSSGIENGSSSEFKQFSALNNNEKVSTINNFYIPLCISKGIETGEFEGADFGEEAGYHAINPVFDTDIDIGGYDSFNINSDFNNHQEDLQAAMDEHLCAVVACIEANDNQPNNSTVEEEIVSFYVTLVQEAMNNSGEAVRGEYNNLSFEVSCGITDSVRVLNCRFGLKDQ